MEAIQKFVNVMYEKKNNTDVNLEGSIIIFYRNYEPVLEVNIYTYINIYLDIDETNLLRIWVLSNG